MAHYTVKVKKENENEFRFILSDTLIDFTFLLYENEFALYECFTNSKRESRLLEKNADVVFKAKHHPTIPQTN